MAFSFTRQQLLEEADRYLVQAAALPDTDPAKPTWIKASADLCSVVMARIYNAILASENNIPDDLEH